MAYTRNATGARRKICLFVKMEIFSRHMRICYSEAKLFVMVFGAFSNTSAAFHFDLDKLTKYSNICGLPRSKVDACLKAITQSFVSLFHISFEYIHSFLYAYYIFTT